MTEMINACRLHNSIASVALTRRVAIEARHYLERRIAFGRRVADHALARAALDSIDMEQQAALHQVFSILTLRERVDAGDRSQLPLLRFLNSLSKYWTARLAVRAASEGMELVGGNGYIEDSVFCRLLRDAQVLPIWEGTSHIQILECLRTIEKHGAAPQLFYWLRECSTGTTGPSSLLRAAVHGLERDLLRIGNQEDPEVDFRGWMHRTCRAVQLAVVIAHHGPGDAVHPLTCHLTKHLENDSSPLA